MATIAADGTMGVTDDAEQFVKDMAATHGPVRLTGHSAGGTLAMAINDRVGEDVVSSVVGFQAPRAGAVLSGPEARVYQF